MGGDCGVKMKGLRDYLGFWGFYIINFGRQKNIEVKYTNLKCVVLLLFGIKLNIKENS